MLQRPELAPGQEWVWDYPRPPRLETANEIVRVEFAGVEIARSSNAVRILETSHPPVYYLPPDDVHMSYLQRSGGSSYCEWKGAATYYDLVAGERRVARAAWTYVRPSPSYAQLGGYIAFYPGRVDACYVGEERVRAQAGDFYGGWITANIAGPFKGAPGTAGW